MLIAAAIQRIFKIFIKTRKLHNNKRRVAYEINIVDARPAQASEVL
jgi:hypothetical protein